MKLDIIGSNNDIESIIQDYIDDLDAFDKHKEQYSPVMSELMIVMHKNPRYAFTGRLMKLNKIILLNFYCNKCKHTFGGLQYPFAKLKVYCYKCYNGLF